MANKVAELIFIPMPGVGHIMSTIEIAKLLINRDQTLSVTLLVIKHFSDTSSDYVQSLANKPLDRIRFIEIPRGQTPPDIDPTKAPMTFFNEFIKSHRKFVGEAVDGIMGSGRVVGVVVDMFTTSMIDVALELNVPAYVYFTSNAAFLGFQLYIEAICSYGNQDVTEFGNSDEEFPVPSFVNPVPSKVFPSLVQTKQGLDFFRWSSGKMREAKGIVVNTFLEVERYAIESLSSDGSVPPVYPVGPILNVDGGAGKASNGDLIGWLDGQPRLSVVFLCFGSMGCFEEVQVKEIAYALERSGYRFVWSLRRPPSSDQASRAPGDYEDLAAVLPEGFLERTKGIGKVIGWAPQGALLAHPAVGGFVSHCGWNSVLESLWFGVPLATWPIYAEQQMNAFEMVVELGLAVEINLDYKIELSTGEGNTVIVKSKVIEHGIRRLMGDDEVRAKVKEMCKKSRAAVVEGGSSYNAVGCFIKDLTRNVF